MRRGIGFGLLLGALVGAGLMFVLDPDRGLTRRSLARGKALGVGRRLGDRLGSQSRDVRNRLRGKVIEAQAALSEAPVSDEVLIERIRARLGHRSENTRNILVTVKNGMATVAGPVLAGEVDAVIRCVQGVRGVRGITNSLDVHRSLESLTAHHGERFPRD